MALRLASPRAARRRSRWYRGRLPAEALVPAGWRRSQASVSRRLGSGTGEVGVKEWDRSISPGAPTAADRYANTTQLEVVPTDRVGPGSTHPVLLLVPS